MERMLRRGDAAAPGVADNGDGAQPDTRKAPGSPLPLGAGGGVGLGWGWCYAARTRVSSFQVFASRVEKSPVTVLSMFRSARVAPRTVPSWCS